jgi:hypothetical protein
MSAIANVSSMLVQSARLNQNQMIQVASLNQQRSINFHHFGLSSVLTHDFSKAVKLAVCKVFRKNFVASNSYTKSVNTLK